jgi:hypothetical protein
MRRITTSSGGGPYRKGCAHNGAFGESMEGVERDASTSGNDGSGGSQTEVNTEKRGLLYAYQRTGGESGRGANACAPSVQARPKKLWNPSGALGNGASKSLAQKSSAG